MSTQSEMAPGEGDVPGYDAIIIGAGMSGMYQLYRLRQLGLSVRVFEAGGDLGGTWYWNRYPGARFDSESYSYGFSFSEEVLNEWNWSEHFAAQPETLRYLDFVADKFDLRRDMQFSSKVMSARFDEATSQWEIQLENNERARGRLLVTALGPLSAYTPPNIKGRDSFRGESFHTARWPHHPVQFEGKRVAVIGTGASGVQTIQEVAKTAKELVVFQRTPNWCAPLHNRPMDEGTLRDIKARYAEIFATCKDTPAGFIHKAFPVNAMDVAADEREAYYEKLYALPGFSKWQTNYRDLPFSQTANDTFTDFLARKIRQRVKDPKVAEKLIPKNHGFGTRRIPLETRYYEVYNQANVRLVDVNEEPIECITQTGIKTGTGHYEFDVIIFATGFDAVTGPFDRIDIRGRDGQSLKEKWADGPQTYLGIQIHGFPNMFTLVGPHNAATRCNMPRCIEQNVEWVTQLVQFMQQHGYDMVEASREAEIEWTKHVHEVGEGLLLTKVNSWYTGINSNVEGKTTRRILTYLGGVPRYRAKCDEVAANSYEGFVLSSSGRQALKRSPRVMAHE